jgi:hypothetical protein
VDLLQTKDLVDRAIENASEREAPVLKALRQSLDDGEAELTFGDLPRHPLFLHFILEDITSEEFAAATPPELLRRWLARKLRRDRAVWVRGTVAERPMVRPDLDTDEFIRRMLAALEELAFQLTSQDGSQKVLEESTSDVEVRATVGRHFEKVVEILPVLLRLLTRISLASCAVSC